MPMVERIKRATGRQPSGSPRRDFRHTMRNGLIGFAVLVAIYLAVYWFGG